MPPRRDLRGELVVAARRDDDRLGAEPHSGGDRLVGRGVAGVQRDEQVDRLLARVVDDRGRLEPCLVVAEPLRDPAHGLDHRRRCCRARRARRACRARARTRRARGSCTPCRSRRRRRGCARAPRAAAAGAARRSAAPAAPCRARSSSRGRADGRRAADGCARGRARASAPRPTTASPVETSHVPFFVRRACTSPLGREQVHVARVARAARRAGRPLGRAAPSRCAARRRPSPPRRGERRPAWR